MLPSVICLRGQQPLSLKIVIVLETVKKPTHLGDYWGLQLLKTLKIKLIVD